MADTVLPLDLDNLLEGLPGVTKATGAYLREAAIVALAKNGHPSGVEMKVEGLFPTKAKLSWKEENQKEIVHAWKNDRESANFGAVGIALLLVQQLSDYKSFELSDLGTGIDFWMGRAETAENAPFFLKKEARLEISGIFKESPANTVQMRVQLKKKQISASDDTGLPGWVAIVEFGRPKTKIIRK